LTRKSDCPDQAFNFNQYAGSPRKTAEIGLKTKVLEPPDVQISKREGFAAVDCGVDVNVW
jgi:hypothetical protein